MAKNISIHRKHKGSLCQSLNGKSYPDLDNVTNDINLQFGQSQSGNTTKPCSKIDSKFSHAN